MKAPTFPPRVDEWIPGKLLSEPPLPKWAFNPHYVVVESKVVQMDSGLDQLLVSKRQELISKGIPPGLAARAVRWAQEYAHGLTTMLSPTAQEGEVVYRRALAYGLGKAEDWARGILRAISV